MSLAAFVAALILAEVALALAFLLALGSRHLWRARAIRSEAALTETRRQLIALHADQSISRVVDRFIDDTLKEQP